MRPAASGQRPAAIKNALSLPQELSKSLTLDRGSEMHGNTQFTMANYMQVHLYRASASSALPTVPSSIDDDVDKSNYGELCAGRAAGIATVRLVSRLVERQRS